MTYYTISYLQSNNSNNKGEKEGEKLPFIEKFTVEKVAYGLKIFSIIPDKHTFSKIGVDIF